MWNGKIKNLIEKRLNLVNPSEFDLLQKKRLIATQ